MSQSLLITHADFIPYADINVNINDVKKLNPYILQAQFIDIKKFLGVDLYNDLLLDFDSIPSLSKYSNLLNGSTYTINSKSYTHEGLKPVLVYYAYSRYIINKNDNDTAYGLVQKKNEFSEPSNDKALTRKSDYANSIANAYLDSVISFLNYSKYPFWKNNCSSENDVKQTRRITSI